MYKTILSQCALVQVQVSWRRVATSAFPAIYSWFIPTYHIFADKGSFWGSGPNDPAEHRLDGFL